MISHNDRINAGLDKRTDYLSNKHTHNGPKKTRQGSGRCTKFRRNSSGKKVDVKRPRGQGGRKR